MDASCRAHVMSVACAFSLFPSPEGGPPSLSPPSGRSLLRTRPTPPWRPRCFNQDV
ncbi:unnamed protein product [Spirodela intermedia]|uniref:Uncharacterized protein n=1 Tax=Spirodela intermedia TaxID=51605 RepID=A0A7I8K445_SPIIN|nr:unnamed protein product [Spirodela intermedia]